MLVRNTLKVIYEHEFDINDKNMSIVVIKPGALRPYRI